jgi:outer membrane protein TolC
MTLQSRWWYPAVLVSMLGAVPARGDVLTAERAVQIALQRNTSVVQARAGVLDARSGLYSAYSGMLPQLSASLARAGSRTDGRTGSQLFGSVVTPSSTSDIESYSTTPGLNGTWPLLDLSSISGVMAARNGVNAARFRQQSTRQVVAFNTRQQFYTVVQAIRLADVASSALKLSRDDERRVRALFEVGSVSRSDLLKAQVATAQSKLDSLNAAQTVVNQRIALAELLGIPEAEMGDVDTTLAVQTTDVDEAALRREAAAARPDLRAADAQWHAARQSLRAANLARLPFLSVSGGVNFDSKSSFTQKTHGTEPVFAPGPDSVITVPGPVVKSVIGSVTDPVVSGRGSSDRVWSGQVALTWNIFSGMATESRIATAQADLARAADARNVLWRNLDAEVHQAVLQYRQAVQQDAVAKEGVASAEENLKLTQQKYNVGSATILDLIDAQVQLQRAESNSVSALASIRVAEAQLNRVRGRSE